MSEEANVKEQVGKKEEEKEVKEEKANKKNSRTANYSKEEDISLCRSWIAISQDGIIGVSQKGKDFWQRILDDSGADLAPSRTWRSVQTRFQLISREAQIFTGLNEVVFKLLPSGQDASAVETNAHTAYKERYKKPFPFYDEWKYLNNFPKWKASMVVTDLTTSSSTASSPSSIKSSATSSSSSTSSSTSEEVSVVVEEEKKGVKRMKQEKKNDEEDKVFKKKRLAIDEMMAKAVQGRASALQDSANLELFQVDTSTLDASGAAYVALKRKVILKNLRKENESKVDGLDDAEEGEQ
jgi:hypothetical protein